MISILVLNIFSTISIITSIYFGKKIVNPLSMMNLIWMVVMNLSSLKLFNLITPDENVYWMFTAGIIAYNIIYIAFMILGRSIRFSEKRTEVLLREKVIIFLSIFSIVFYTPLVLSSIRIIIMSGSFNQIRASIQAGLTTGNYDLAILNAINLIIVSPFAYSLPVLASADFWFGKRNLRIMGLAIVVVTMQVLLNGGRSPIIHFLFFFLLGYYFLKKKPGSNFIKKHRKFIILVFLVGIFFFVRTTISRQQGQEFQVTYYYYFSMQPRMFDYWTVFSEQLGIQGYGLASLNGFLFPFFYVLNHLLNIPMPELIQNIFELIQLTDQQWVIIAGNTKANAYVSTFWYFFVDGGFAGIIIGMILYAILSAIFFSKVLKSLNVRSFSMYAVLLIGIFFSFVRFPFSGISYSLSFIFIGLLTVRVECSTTSRRSNRLRKSIR